MLLSGDPPSPSLAGLTDEEGVFQLARAQEAVLQSYYQIPINAPTPLSCGSCELVERIQRRMEQPSIARMRAGACK